MHLLRDARTLARVGKQSQGCSLRITFSERSDPARGNSKSINDDVTEAVSGWVAERVLRVNRSRRALNQHQRSAVQ